MGDSKVKLTASQAREICGYFDPKRQPDGRLACSHLFDGELCDVPSLYRCEVLSYRERAEAGANAWSVSRARSFQSCPRMYWLQYIVRAKTPTVPEWALVGSEFAKCRAKIDDGRPWELAADVEAQLKPEAAAKLRATLRVYEQQVKMPDLRSEIRVQLSYRGIAIQGYIDGITPDFRHLYEWKYAASEESYTALTMGRQLSVYMADESLRGVEEATVAVARKSRLKLKKGEELEEYEERVVADLSAHSPFFFRTYKRSEFNTIRELDEIVTVASLAALCRKMNIWPTTTSNCSIFGGCQWQPFCASQVAADVLGSLPVPVGWENVQVKVLEEVGK